MMTRLEELVLVAALAAAVTMLLAGVCADRGFKAMREGWDADLVLMLKAVDSAYERGRADGLRLAAAESECGQ